MCAGSFCVCWFIERTETSDGHWIRIPDDSCVPHQKLFQIFCFVLGLPWLGNNQRHIFSVFWRTFSISKGESTLFYGECKCFFRSLPPCSYTRFPFHFVFAVHELSLAVYSMDPLTFWMSPWQLNEKLTRLSSSSCCRDFERIESRKSYYVSTFSIQLSTFQFCCTSSECSLCPSHVDGSYGKATSCCWHPAWWTHCICAVQHCVIMRNCFLLWIRRSSLVRADIPRWVFQLNSVWCLPSPQFWEIVARHWNV